MSENKVRTFILILLITILFVAFIVSWSEDYVISHQNLIEQPSPRDRINMSRVHVYENYIVIDIINATWSTVRDTNSMDPLIDINDKVIYMKPLSIKDIQIGDIISFQPSDKTWGNGSKILHRVYNIDYDEMGTYYITKGDNVKLPDTEKIRFNEIDGIVVALIY